MIKSINWDDIKPGMYIQQPGFNWKDHWYKVLRIDNEALWLEYTNDVGDLGESRYSRYLTKWKWNSEYKPEPVKKRIDIERLQRTHRFASKHLDHELIELTAPYLTDIIEELLEFRKNEEN